MAINKKLIHFKTFSNFNSKKLSANEENTQYTLGVNGNIVSGSPDILYQSICWIKDTKQIWTHGVIYDGKSYESDISSLEGSISILTNNKVDKVSGKGLSTNDYTTTEKNKLSGIASGAEVNVQSDWNVTSTTSDAYIKNKPTLAKIATSGSYSDLSGAPTSLKNPSSLTVGSKTYDGSSSVEIKAADLGLGSALKYLGKTSTSISDGSTTQQVTIGGLNVTAATGDVVIDSNDKKEYIWNGSQWEEFGNEGNYKTKQTAKSSPTASSTASAFIDTISQDENGVITATKKSLPTGSASTKGILKVGSNISVSSGTLSLSKTNVTTALGYTPPESDTTYENATTSTAGLMSSADKYKLDNISSGAEVNQNAFSNITIGSTTIAADSKTDTLTLVAGSNVTITPDATNDKITISATDTNTTYSAGSGISLSGTTFSHADTSTLSGNYGPTADVTGSNGKTIVVPQITVDDYGHVTGVTNRTYTSKDTTYSTMTGASSSANGAAGLVPKPTAGNQGKFLKADGTWATPTNTTYSDATTSTSGLMSASDKSKLDGIAAGAKIGTVTSITPGVGLKKNGENDGTSTSITSSGTIDLQVASTSEIGGIKVKSVETSTVTLDTATTSKNYGINVDSNGQAYVALPAFTTNTGDITGVTAGSGLTGGATSGAATLHVGAGAGISVSADAVACDLNSTTSLGTLGSTSKLYAVGIDSNGKLAVNVPWTDNDTKSFTITADASDDDVVVLSGANGSNKVTYSASHAKKGPSNGYTSGNATTSISGSGGSGTIKVPQLTVDSYGHVTAASDESVTITLPTIPSSLKNPKSLTVGSKTYDGSSAVTIYASDLGLSGAMKYIGKTSTSLSDGSTTKIVVIDGLNVTMSSSTSGNVVLYDNKEFIWDGTKWEIFGDEGSYKVKQNAVSSPSASGNTTSFIDTISQDANGVITATKKTVSTASTSASGLMSSSDKSKLDGIATGATAVTESTVSGWGFTKNSGTYSKPSSGIPKTDLASSVQTSLGKADTALQAFTESDPIFSASASANITSADITNWNSKTSNTGTITKVQANGTDVASSGTANIPAASTSKYGVTKLSSATNSTSTSLAATASAVKAAYDLAASKTSNTGTITGVKMNGTSMGTSGVVDLGTVITAHQDISGKLDATTAESTYLKKRDANDTYLGKTAKAASASTADSVAWSGITNKPTTVDGFGITDALKTSGGSITGNLSVTGTIYNGGATRLCGASEASATGVAMHSGAKATGVHSTSIGYLANTESDYSLALGNSSYAGVKSNIEGYPFGYIKSYNTLPITVNGTTLYGTSIGASSTITYTYNGTSYTASNTHATNLWFVVLINGGSTFIGSSIHPFKRCSLYFPSSPAGTHPIIDRYTAIQSVREIQTGIFEVVIYTTTQSDRDFSAQAILYAMSSGNDTNYNGNYTIAGSLNSIACGTCAISLSEDSVASGSRSIALNYQSMASGHNSIAFSPYSVASGSTSIALGFSSVASGSKSIAIGEYSNAKGDYSYAFGSNSVALGRYAITFGTTTTASGDYSISFGRNSIASGTDSCAIGYRSKAGGARSVAIGEGSQALSSYSITMGYESIASADYAVAFGPSSKAVHPYSYVFARGGITGHNDQSVFGRYNVAANAHVFVVGWGSSDSSRKNILTLDTTGNLELAGNVRTGSDIRKKDKIEDVEIDILSIANAPLFNYKWNDRDDETVYLGTAAQYWNNTAFKNAVHSTVDDSMWTISYSEIALGNTISLARNLIKTDKRIEALENRIIALETENKSLKELINK